MANHQNLLTLAEHIELGRGEDYDQGEWSDLPSARGERVPTCGSVGCIAGHAAMMAGYVVLENGRCYLPDQDETSDPGRDVEYVAAEWLDIDSDVTAYLFTGKPQQRWPSRYGDYWSDLTPRNRASRAAELLRDLADSEFDVWV